MIPMEGGAARHMIGSVSLGKSLEFRQGRLVCNIICFAALVREQCRDWGFETILRELSKRQTMH